MVWCVTEVVEVVQTVSECAVSADGRIGVAANYGRHVPVDMTPTAVCLCTRSQKLYPINLRTKPPTGQ